MDKLGVDFLQSHCTELMLLHSPFAYFVSFLRWSLCLDKCLDAALSVYSHLSGRQGIKAQSSCILCHETFAACVSMEDCIIHWHRLPLSLNYNQALWNAALIMLSRTADSLFIKKKSQITESPSHQSLFMVILMIRSELSETVYEKQNLEDGLT